MNLSLTAISILKTRYGKGELNGFEASRLPDISALSNDAAFSAFDELSSYDLVALVDDTVHISALGHHILNMMIHPDIFIMIDNDLMDVNVRIYVRGIYYLCVTENKAIFSDTNAERFSVDLVPGFEQIVGAFVYALYKKNSETDTSLDEENAVPERQKADFSITGISGEDRLSVSGTSDGEQFSYTLTKDRNEPPTECDICTITNKLTAWMFDRLAAILAREENNDGTD